MVGNATTKTRRHEKELGALRVFAPSWPKALKISRAFGLGNVTDTEYMERALFLAERGRGRTSPNPMVGAVIVSTGALLGRDFTSAASARQPRAHLAGDAPAAPSCMHARTVLPSPHWAVRERIVRPASHGSWPPWRIPIRPCRAGGSLIFAPWRRVEIGPGRENPRLNQPFLTLIRDRRPFVILKAATSIDGCVAEAPATRTKLTSAAADRHAHAFRAEVDAIGVGVGTVLADDPLLTVRGIYRERPLTRVIFDRRLRTHATARLLSTLEAGPVIIVTTAAAAARADIRRPLEARGAQIEVAVDDSFRSALELLAAREIGSLLLEGGAAMHGAAWDDRLVDFVRLYVTPIALGRGGVPFLGHRAFATGALAERRVEALGDDTLIEGYVHRLD